MNIQTDTTVDEYFNFFADPQRLADSLESTAADLESLSLKHDSKSPQAGYLGRGFDTCNRLASELRIIKTTSNAWKRFINELEAMRERGEDHFYALHLIRIELQTRVGNEFPISSAIQFLDRMTTLVFAINAVNDPRCMVGVGHSPFGPRSRFKAL